MEKEVHYAIDKREHMGFLATKSKEQRPVIIVCHAFEGRNALSIEYARFFASLGYVGFAADLFGEKKVEITLEGCMGQIKPFFTRRNLVLERLYPVLDLVSSLDCVQKEQIGVIGFCFGGMCALDLARNSDRIKGAVSVHGILTKPEKSFLQKIQAKVLVLHGDKDPQISKEEIENFKKEMDEKKADWQMHIYGNAKHAFTDPKAFEIGSQKMGREYNLQATTRMQKFVEIFFDEIFC
jgi:dienelactone hydrolase